ncbi:MAG TPA: sugar phosphate nucleotidyltransferase [Solirubrobacterales bacterium]|nr:sugar phosphate nucleotidyltransferase [Solirubrobacterales bacterium]
MTDPKRRAVILAGGKGSRLGPYTTVLPKPLLPVGDHAILDVVVHQLRHLGFTELTLAVGYLAHLVRAAMGDGSRWGIEIGYAEEREPLGTVGPLASIEGLDDHFIVMNGDVLTTLDFAGLLDMHAESGNVLTIASHRRVVSTDYGVLHVSEDDGPTQAVLGFEEKPEIPYVVSMGVYAMSPKALSYIEPGARLDLPELVLRLLDAGEPVGSYLFDGYWLDIGRHDDYERAITEFGKLRSVFMYEEAAAVDSAQAADG